jgi:predicted transcriptional regulator
MLDSLADEVEILGRHFQILRTVARDGPIGIVRLSKRTDHAHHKVRYSLRVLEENDLIEPTPQGAVLTTRGEAFVDDADGRIEDLESRVTSVVSDLALEPSVGQTAD